MAYEKDAEWKEFRRIRHLLITREAGEIVRERVNSSSGIGIILGAAKTCTSLRFPLNRTGVNIRAQVKFATRKMEERWESRREFRKERDKAGRIC